jgi:hypothetical protein
VKTVLISEPLFTGVLADDTDFMTHNFFSSKKNIKKARKSEVFRVPKYAPSSIKSQIFARSSLGIEFFFLQGLLPLSSLRTKLPQ